MLMAKELRGVMRQLANTEERKKKIDNERTRRSKVDKGCLESR